MNWSARRSKAGRARLGSLVWLAGGICAVMLALLAHSLIRRPDRQRTGLMPSAPARSEDGGTATPATGPAMWTGDHLEAVGLAAPDEDPSGIPLPAGAVRQSGFIRQAAGAAHSVFTYVAEGRLEELEEFYRTRMAAAGYAPLPQPTTLAGARGGIQVFGGPDGRDCSITLIPVETGRKVKIVIVTHDAGIAPPLGKEADGLD